MKETFRSMPPLWIYESSFHAGPAGNYLLSPSSDPFILAVNDVFLETSARTREELVGMRLFAAFPPNPADPDDSGMQQLRRSLRHVLETGRPDALPRVRYPIQVRGADGRARYEERFWNAVSTPIFDGEGTLICISHSTTDITAQVRAEDALRRADRRKDEFLAMLAHELRNPLAPISAAAELLALCDCEDGRVRQASAIISRQARCMSELIDDLLDVSRVTRGLVVLQKETLDGAQLVADAIEQVQPLIEARRHRLAVRLPAHPAFVFGDRKRLVQVMTNLLNNAAKYTPEGGNIELGAALEGPRLSFSISDDGIGMDGDLVEHVFELFAQGQREADRSQGGLGIGLSLVRSLLTLHGGSVSASSAGPGKGSRFVVTLPCVPPPSGAPQRQAQAGGSGRSGRRLKVLLVDDNVDAAMALQLLVEAWGHQALVEHDPRQALELARRERPDVCLLDIGLPGMDGNELAQRLRAQPETAGATLIAVSGYGQEQDRLAAFRAGFDHHLAKPLDSQRLAVVLDRLAS